MIDAEMRALWDVSGLRGIGPFTTSQSGSGFPVYDCFGNYVCATYTPGVSELIAALLNREAERHEEWQNESRVYTEEERARDQRLDCVGNSALVERLREAVGNMLPAARAQTYREMVFRDGDLCVTAGTGRWIAGILEAVAALLAAPAEPEPPHCFACGFPKSEHRGAGCNQYRVDSLDFTAEPVQPSAAELPVAFIRGWHRGADLSLDEANFEALRRYPDPATESEVKS